MRNRITKILALITLVAAGLQAQAAPTVGKFEYKAAGMASEGFLAVPKNTKGKVPGVLIVHDWMGPSEFTQKKAQQVADLGYVGLAVDIYGKGNSPKDQKGAGEIAGKYKADRKLLREKIKAAYEELKQVPNVDPHKIVVMGYCFGGTTALELGRAGTELAGVVSFHGGLANPTPGDAKNIKGKTLVMHGAIDPYVGADEVAAFQKEMNEAGVDYQFISYSGAVHAFAVPGAGSDTKTGAAYNAVADHRSWEEFKRFMIEATTVR
jgi:dienelactone hydrolase